MRTLSSLANEELVTLAHIATDWAYDYPDVVISVEDRYPALSLKSVWFSFEGVRVGVIITQSLNFKVQGDDFDNQHEVFELLRKWNVEPIT